MDDCRRVSEAMYVGLCRQIGTPTEVVIRRELMDVDEMIHRRVYLNEGVIFVQSGSYREGFIFNSSDIDVMVGQLGVKLSVGCPISMFPTYVQYSWNIQTPLQVL